MHNYTVNRLVQELFRQPGLLERFRSRRSEVYDEYGLDPAHVPASTTARRRRSPRSASTRSCRCTFCLPATPTSPG